MTMYVKHPKEMEAVQWFKEGDHKSVKPCHWISEEVGMINIGPRTTTVYPGDWIVGSYSEEFEVLCDAAFKRTYKEVEDIL